MSEDKKFNGKFNYYGQVFNLWTTAKNRSKAHKNFMFQLVDKLSLDKINGYRMIRFYFSDRANYEIKQEN